MRLWTVLQGRASAAGISLGLSGALVRAGSKPGRWLKLESPNVIVQASHTSANTCKELAALERYHAVLTRFLQPCLQPARKLNVCFEGVDRISTCLRQV